MAQILKVRVPLGLPPRPTYQGAVHIHQQTQMGGSTPPAIGHQGREDPLHHLQAVVASCHLQEEPTRLVDLGRIEGLPNHLHQESFLSLPMSETSIDARQFQREFMIGWPHRQGCPIGLRGVLELAQTLEHLAGYHGSLAPGAAGDVSVLRRGERTVPLVDLPDGPREGQAFEPVVTVRAGELFEP